MPWFPATLLMLVLAIVASAVLNLDDHGVDIVGDLPSALPDLALPDVGASDLVNLIAPALGILVLTAEGARRRPLRSRPRTATRSTRTAT